MGAFSLPGKEQARLGQNVGHPDSEHTPIIPLVSPRASSPRLSDPFCEWSHVVCVAEQSLPGKGCLGTQRHGCPTVRSPPVEDSRHTHTQFKGSCLTGLNIFLLVKAVLPTSVTLILKSVGSPSGGRSNFHEMFEYTLLKMVSDLLFE